MAIFILDTKLKESAEALDDKSLDSMIRVIAQVLCQIHFQYIDYHAPTTDEASRMAADIPIQAANVFDKRRNAWANWGYESCANYKYLVEFGLECSDEWTWRRHSSQLLEPEFHKMHSIIEWTHDNMPNLPEFILADKGKNRCNLPIVDKVYFKMTPLPLVMPKKYLYHSSCKEKNEEEYLLKYAMLSYRRYYSHSLIKNRKVIPTWTRREKPEWLNLNLNPLL